MLIVETIARIRREHFIKGKTITQPALATSRQSRTTPTRRALPPNLVVPRGQNWTPMQGQISTPINRVLLDSEFNGGCRIH